MEAGIGRDSSSRLDAQRESPARQSRGAPKTGLSKTFLGRLGLEDLKQ